MKRKDFEQNKKKLMKKTVRICRRKGDCFSILLILDRIPPCQKFLFLNTFKIVEKDKKSSSSDLNKWFVSQESRFIVYQKDPL